MTIQNMRDNLEKYLDELRQNEKAASTIGKYRRDIEKFMDFIGEDNRQIIKDDVINYKAHLSEAYKTASVNSYLIALNKYLEWIGAGDLKTHVIRQQQRNSLDNVMSRTDYERVLRFAKKLDKTKIYYVMRTLAASGIRIEELKFVTVEAVTKGRGCIEVNNKGKIRGIVIPPDLCKELRKYCKDNGIASGVIFHNREKTGMIDKSYLWREMKYIAGQARVNKSKVHAHSFRHLFAKTYMEANGNVVELADLLGHSSLETTRIYTRSSSKEKRDKVSKLGL